MVPSRFIGNFNIINTNTTCQVIRPISFLAFVLLTVFFCTGLQVGDLKLHNHEILSSNPPFGRKSAFGKLISNTVATDQLSSLIHIDMPCGVPFEEFHL